MRKQLYAYGLNQGYKQNIYCICVHVSQPGVVLTNTFKAFHHSFSYVQRTARLQQALHTVCQAQTCLGYVHKENKTLLMVPLPFSGTFYLFLAQADTWGSDPGSQLLFFPLPITNPISVHFILTHYPRNLQIKLDTRASKERTGHFKESGGSLWAAGDCPMSLKAPCLITTIATYIQGGWVKPPIQLRGQCDLFDPKRLLKTKFSGQA